MPKDLVISGGQTAIRLPRDTWREISREQSCETNSVRDSLSREGGTVERGARA